MTSTAESAVFARSIVEQLAEIVRQADINPDLSNAHLQLNADAILQLRRILRLCAIFRMQ
jgi:hypothetical protein